MISKGAICEGAFKLLVIWGITSKPTNEELNTALGVLDDYATQLESTGLLTGYDLPAEYGESDINDDSGLVDWMAGPFKKLLAIELLTIYGKAITPMLMRISGDAMRSLEHALVNVEVAQNPATLPIGSGNESNTDNRTFYGEQDPYLNTETDGTVGGITL